MSSKKILEIACFNLESVLIAESAGADRIELCEEYKEGGLTPSHKFIQKARNEIKIPIHVIIRPRGGNFVYSEEEINEMQRDISFCKTNGINGIVFGILTKNNEIDLNACKRLIDLARPMSVTFHRAFDTCGNLDIAIRNLITLGINRVLTSGGKGNAIDNIPALEKMQKKYNNKLNIMPGGGIRSTNISEIMESGCDEFHSAAITGKNELADASEINKLRMLLTRTS